jgi:hypothetical protein
MQQVNEDCLSLDSNRLAQMGVFKTRNVSAKAQWEDGSNILLTYARERMNLKYSINGRPYTQAITISTMPCHTVGAAKEIFATEHHIGWLYHMPST